MSESRESKFDRRLGRPAIEPLSDVAWARVERAVFAEVGASVLADEAVPRRRRWTVLIAPLAAAAALVVWLVVRPGADLGHESPARVVTADSPTEVNFGDAVITAAARSSLVMSGSVDGGVMVVLERGAATFEVSPREHRPAFRVQAGQVSVRVVGTRFVVSRRGDDASIQVIEGTVEVVARGRRDLVPAGSSWPAPETAAAPVDQVPDAAMAPFDAGPSIEPATPSPTRKRRAVAPAPVEYDDEDDEDLGPREPTSKEQFEEAARLERGDPAGALRQYVALARGTGPWAANALFAAGRLSYDRADVDGAKRLLTRYLRRFPRGGNAADARALLDRL